MATVSSLIACPDCRHRLTLPETFIGKRVQCPKCGFEFEAAEAPVPVLAVDTAESAAPPSATAAPATKNGTPAPAPQGAYAPYDGPPAAPETARPPSTDGRTILCTECGARFRRDHDSCPVCGYRTDLMLDEPRERRRPRPRIMQPVSNILPILTAILIPSGFVLLIGIPIIDELLRIRGAVEDILIGLICFAMGIMELAAIICGCVWLYQAWRAVQRGDEEYPPGLMVGLLFVPFFNFYWMFRAIPGLSTAIQQEMSAFGPRRMHGAGFIPGIVGCVFMLIPYFQPVALCIFIAWMLIVNNALQRLIRYHEDGQDVDELRGDPADY